MEGEAKGLLIQGNGQMSFVRDFRHELLPFGGRESIELT